MSDSFSFDIINYKEIKRALDRLGPDQGKAVAMAGREAARKILVPALMRAAPANTGELEDAFKVISKVSAKHGTVDVKVGVDPKIVGRHLAIRRDGSTYMKRVVPSRYLHLVEKGHKKGRGKGAAPANPFMRRTFVQKRERMTQVFENALNKSIEKVWKTVQRRKAKKGR